MRDLMLICPDDHMEGPRTSQVMSAAFRKAFFRLRASLPKATELVVLVGLPGSGKSTWAARNDRPDRVIFDACNLSRAERLKLLNAGARASLPVDVVEFLDPKEVCSVRQRRRSGPSRVSEERIASMQASRQFVRTDEGFRQHQQVF